MTIIHFSRLYIYKIKILNDMEGKKRIALTLDRETLKGLDNLADSNKISKSSVVKLLINHYVDE